MLREVVGRAGLAVAGKVIGRRAAHELRAADPRRHEILAADRADAHRDVEALVDEIDDAVGQLDVEAHVGMALGEFGDRGREIVRAEGDAAGEAQRAARHDSSGAGRRFGLVEIGEELYAALVKGAAGLGERKAAGRAVEQARAEVRLELGHVPRHRRHRHAEPVGGAREAAGLDDPGEGIDGVEAVHGGRGQLLHNTQQYFK